MEGGNKMLVTIASMATLLSVGLVLVAKYVMGAIRRSAPKGNWRRVGEIAELHIYPVKSCKGISVEEARLLSIGMTEVTTAQRPPLGDRRMVIYKVDAMEFISARTYPHLLQIEVGLATNGKMHLDYDGSRVEFEIPSGKPDRKIRLWTEQVPVVDCGDDVADWLKKIVFDDKTDVRLGYWPGDHVRRDIPHLVAKYNSVFPEMKNEFTGAYSDLGPYLLLNEASVAELKGKIDERNKDDIGEGQLAVSSKNFRGNIIIRGPSAYEEDTYEWVRIGDNVVFRNFKPCTRCSLTTIDPDTSVRNKNLEPITTLKTYRLLDEEKRKLDSSPVMGIYVGLHDASLEGEIIKVGQPVYVSD
ncbi:cofactor sulfurase [Nesidiocoris tenuis]|uniref:Cofactor sulfurase n=1 Tax=Nesidiocoris tenuis TaxID=355587 RepID=A0ABN7B9Q3_9HEMI|nr:cofactor sulfurase [Nesidiocoris tenuis]